MALLGTTDQFHQPQYCLDSRNCDRIPIRQPRQLPWQTLGRDRQIWQPISRHDMGSCRAVARRRDRESATCPRRPFPT